MRPRYLSGATCETVTDPTDSKRCKAARAASGFACRAARRLRTGGIFFHIDDRARAPGSDQPAGRFLGAALMSRMKELETENARLKKMYAEERLKADVEAIGRNRSAGGQFLDNARRIAWALQDATDAVAATGIWWGAYNDGVGETVGKKDVKPGIGLGFRKRPA